jgi:hypothetical protein
MLPNIQQIFLSVDLFQQTKGNQQKNHQMTAMQLQHILLLCSALTPGRNSGGALPYTRPKF